jgi:hypothetical protein
LVSSHTARSLSVRPHPSPICDFLQTFIVLTGLLEPSSYYREPRRIVRFAGGLGYLGASGMTAGRGNA